MADPLRKVNPGDPQRIPAAAYNAFIDAAREARNRQHNIRAGGPGEGWPAGTVPVKNASGADVGRFGVLGLAGVLYGPDDNLEGFKNQPVLSGETPTADHAGAFVVLLEPVADGKVGLGVVAGAVVVRVNVSNAEHQHADVDAGSTARLASGVAGSAQIAWVEEGTGEKWAVVRLGNRTIAPPGRVHLLNNTAGNRDAYTVLAVTTPVVTPTENAAEFEAAPILTGDAAGATDGGRLAVLTEPIPAGEYGWAVLSGLAVCRLTVTADNESYTYASGADPRLEPTQDGPARILWKEAGAGTKWGLVHLALHTTRCPLGTADYDLLYWDTATETWELLPLTGDSYKVLQRKADATLGYDYVRAHA